MKLTKKEKRVIHQINAGQLTKYRAKSKGFEAATKKLIDNGFLIEKENLYLDFTEKTKEIMELVYSDGEPEMIVK